MSYERACAVCVKCCSIAWVPLLGRMQRCRALTGSDCVRQAAFLIPAGIILYTVAGGLKATFIASYVHTVIIYVALCIFSFSVYATCPQLGSPGVVRPGTPRACSS